MKSTKIFALILVVVMCVSMFASCGLFGDNNTDNPDNGGNNNGGNTSIYQPIDLADVVVREDFTSVYEMIGSKVTADMVEENEDGIAFVTVDGVKYELGMDFLSMAMVYNVAFDGEKFKSEEEVYNFWYKLYIVRWNYLAAEVPLYSNEYYDLYNAKIEGFVTTPYWSPADAIVASTIKDGNANSVILGSSTDLSGAFRNSSWGKSSPGSSDLDIQNLTTGYSTLMTDTTGTYVYNMKALAEEPTVEEHEDGSKTYTIKIRNDLKFSDGSAITAKNYIAATLANSTEVAVAAGGTGSAGQVLAGYDNFKAYTGANAGEAQKDKDGKDTGVVAAKYFEGVKLIDDYTFSVTVVAEYAQYYYAYTYAGFSPDPMALYLGENDIIVDENGSCGIADGFYATEKKDDVDTYVMVDVINANLKWNSKLPYSGPYVVSNYDESALIATLTINPNYPGDVRGVASIETITYIKVETATQMDKFTQGEVDIIAGITGGDETKAALKVVADNPEKYAETHYARAGYGKMGFRGDFGSTQFTSVRQAIMYTLNRPEFAQQFTGGYGTVVHGPYYEGFGAFQANKDEFAELLNTYSYSVDDAIAVLEEDGWIYNAEGKEFDASKDAIRYKKLSGYEISANNLNFKSTDSKYATVKIDGEYYMPLVVNWYGTQPNDVTDLLITSWQESKAATEQIGMYITYTSCDFTTGLYGEYLQMEEAGFDGVAKLSCINFATGFTSAIFDYSWNWTIDPALYNDLSAYYIMDEADFYSNYAK